MAALLRTAGMIVALALGLLAGPAAFAGPADTAARQLADAIERRADLTSFASLAGCPAVNIPMGYLPDGLPIGLQLVGARGSDLRLLELASVCAATLDVEPDFPAIV